MTTPPYILDVPYRSAFNPLQAPARLALAAGIAKREPPSLDAAFAYLEIGSGVGATLCVLGDAHPHARFVGIDINAGHIDAARALAKAGNLTNVSFINADVRDLQSVACGPWDFITCAGLFSWLDRSRQDALLAFAGASMTASGLLHLHYASLPGASQADLLHQALRLCARNARDSGERLAEAAQCLLAIANEGGAFFRSNPSARARLAGIVGGDPGDEAHEALTVGTGPTWFAELAPRALGVGITPVACVAGLRAFDEDDWSLAETLEDLRVDRSVRHDLFARADANVATAQVLPPTWYVTPQARAGPGTLRLAALAGIPIAEAGALIDRVSRRASLMDDTETILVAARLGLVLPLVVDGQTHGRQGLSAFNALALRISLARDDAPPLSAPAIGTQIYLPLEDRVRLFALGGGDISSVFEEIDARRNRDPDEQELERRARLGAALSRAALEHFEQQAAPELIRLGVL